ncbi:IS91 family transposase, partial [Methylosarcina fibrata]
RGELQRITRPAEIDTRLRELMQTDWVVYTKAYLNQAETVVQYLARYSRKTALSNGRIRQIDEDQVHLRYKDYRDHDRNKVMVLGGEELIRRFLWHILPIGFMRIRHYGFLANRCRRQKLAQIRHTLQAIAEQEIVEQEVVNSQPVTAPIIEKPQLCPQCQTGRMIVVGEIAPKRIEYG